MFAQRDQLQGPHDLENERRISSMEPRMDSLEKKSSELKEQGKETKDTVDAILAIVQQIRAQKE